MLDETLTSYMIYCLNKVIILHTNYDHVLRLFFLAINQNLRILDFCCNNLSLSYGA